MPIVWVGSERERRGRVSSNGRRGGNLILGFAWATHLPYYPPLLPTVLVLWAAATRTEEPLCCWCRKTQSVLLMLGRPFQCYITYVGPNKLSCSKSKSRLEFPVPNQTGLQWKSGSSVSHSTKKKRERERLRDTDREREGTYTGRVCFCSSGLSVRCLSGQHFSEDSQVSGFVINSSSNAKSFPGLRGGGEGDETQSQSQQST